METVPAFLGVPIDHFAEVNPAGFLQIADALDGVPVCLKRATRDRYSGADFAAGRHTLDGPQSLAFVRQRHGLPNGDLDRTRRQRAFLASATQKLNSSGTLTDPGRLLRLMNAAKQDLVTDEGWDLPSFIKQARNLSSGNIAFTTLPIEGFEKHNGEDVNRVDPDKIKRLVAEKIGNGRGDTGTAARGDGSNGAARSADTEDMSGSLPRKTANRTPSTMNNGGGIPCVD
ncbi:LCP family protein [Streptomyces sp. NPDC055709]